MRTARFTDLVASRERYLFYPGGYLYSTTALFYASGIIKNITVSGTSDILTELLAAELHVYDMKKSVAGVSAGGALILGTPPKKYHIGKVTGSAAALLASYEKHDVHESALNTDGPGTVHGDIAGLAADSIVWSARPTVADTNVNTRAVSFDMHVPCIQGMLVSLEQGGDGGATPLHVSVTYIPWTSGYTRFRQAQRGVMWIDDITATPSGMPSATPTVMTVAATDMPAGLLVGQTFGVTMQGWVDGDPVNPDGRFLATKLTTTTLSIPVDTSSTAATGGTVTVKANSKAGRGTISSS